MNKLEKLKKKVLYRSIYRGTKEMDILLSSFVKQCINKLKEDELEELEKFLNCEDEDIYNFYQNNIISDKIKNIKILKLFKKFKL
jgi:antitoxin CptB|tara:strand:+ start:367 stop:621 length:255 start_codon:yes stop_codon:yes gene_type:complete